MTKDVYKVVSTVQVDGEGKGRYLTLKALFHDALNVSPIYLRSEKFQVGDCLELSVKLATEGSEPIASSSPLPATTDKATPTTYFMHHHDRKNRGDVISGPYHYFKFNDSQKISWDENIIGDKPTNFTTGDSLIIGGGIFFMQNKPRLNKMIKSAKSVIAWGIGMDVRQDLQALVSQFTLLGIRERGSPLIDDKKVFYVPCASCMHPVFDGMMDFKNGTEFGEENFALHLNGGFNKSKLLRAFGNMRHTTTVDDDNDIFVNLANAKCIVTNSYHGAYWGSLMGKKVVCIKCIDPALSAQIRLLKHKPQRGSSCPAPDVDAGSCKSGSSRQSHGWRVAASRTGGGARIGL